MRNIMLTIEYDGAAYVGWQTQKNGLAVQEVMEGVLQRMLGVPTVLESSGRTDSGVHARGMVACFQTDGTLPLRAFREGLNWMLPEDIAVREVREAPLGFHPRFQAFSKHYRYTLLLDRLPSPLRRRTAWRLTGPLDIEAMRQGCAQFVGEHDFSAFRAAGCTARTTVRRIYSFDLVREGDLIHLDVTGSGFLRNMVRVMAGTIVEVGMGRREPSEVASLLQGGPRHASGMTAPAYGLCLMQVFYPPELLP